MFPSNLVCAMVDETSSYFDSPESLDDSVGRADAFLELVERAQKGKLKVYLGYGPGVGKTYRMLQEARALNRQGVDVAIGYVENHGRDDTQALTEGLETVPRRKETYQGIELEEMDVDAILERAPNIALVDELAHTNAPGSRNRKRYEDVMELVEAGISVISTVNVQHLESLYDTVEQLVGVTVKERVPDWVLGEADQVVNVDLTTQDLQQRMEEGKIYPEERVEPALQNFFQQENLEHLRNLTMREVASHIEERGRTDPTSPEVEVPDQVVACLSSRGPDSAAILRYASRLAGRLNRTWYALYVRTPGEAPERVKAETQRILYDTLTLAHQLGATVETFAGEDVVDAILRFADEYGVGHIVIGRSPPLPWWKRVLGRRTVLDRLIAGADDKTVVVLDTTNV
jgi:two-component system sensor histidine kinase KdpD